MDSTTRHAPIRAAGTAAAALTATAGGGAPDRRLADDFFLMVHDDGGPRLTGRVLDLGVAGALIGELALHDAVGILDGLLRAGTLPPGADPLIARIHDRMRREREQLPVRDWLGYIAGTAVEDVGERLLAEGRLERTRSARWLTRRPDRWTPTARGRAGWPAVHVRVGVAEGTQDPRALMLFALAGTTGLNHDSLHSVMDRFRDPGAKERTLAPLAAYRPMLPELLTHIDTAVASAVASRRHT